MGAVLAVIRWIDLINEKVGRAVSWLTLTMLIVTFLVATLRYMFSLGWVWMQESYVWMHGTVFMVAAGYTLLHEGHVRVDIFYRPGSRRFKAGVDLFGVLFLLMPTVGIIFWVALPYVILSWHRLEESREAGGLPGLFLWKTTMIIFCVLLGLQGLALAMRSILTLMGRGEPEEKTEDGEVF
jgi:TRAP-type mannitol/chloroaromatic compound transport system permease small subunit